MSDDWLIGGRERRAIVIEAYDPAWPERFAQERRCVTDALGGLARRVEHIGSTSVPGLGAKPIVDILVAVDDVDDHRIISALERAGYVLRVRETGHRMFRRPDRSVHVHVWREGSEDVARHVLFRDWLRVSADDRDRYESAKRELARRDWDDMNDYADAKSPVVAEITARAQAWAARGGQRAR
jgi:GrpB-like predicted nucleotidyltransferase (UPF0157 family)